MSFNIEIVPNKEVGMVSLEVTQKQQPYAGDSYKDVSIYEEIGKYELLGLIKQFQQAYNELN
jgi:hypothetical protein